MKGAHSRPSGLGNDGCVGSTFFSTFAERFLLFSASNLPLFRDNTGHCCWLFARGLSQKRIPEEEGMLSCGCARVYLGSSLATSQHNSTASCRSWKRPLRIRDLTDTFGPSSGHGSRLVMRNSFGELFR